MLIALDLDPKLEKELETLVETEGVNISLLVQQFLEGLIQQKRQPTAWELGKDGFGSDKTHEGDIAQNTKALLKSRFKNVG